MIKSIFAIVFSFFAFLTSVPAQGLMLSSPPPTHTKAVHFAPKWPDNLFPNRMLLHDPAIPPSRLHLPNPTEHFAFFCRLELKIQNTTKFPVKFRLGDVEYVDMLEGKQD